ncbi:flagellar basal body P-ring formation chaperone FlgA [Shewanella sp.]|nr:flagellar basal body P-ring formation chaperone FlgA [Shewanella sp.]
MVYVSCWRINGTYISYFLFIVSALLPLQVAGKTPHVAAQQIKLQLTEHVQAQLTQWQQQAALTNINSTIKLKLPSGVNKLPACRTALIIEGKSQAPLGNVQRKISCELPKWELYVRANVKVSARLPVAARPLKRGEKIDATDIEWQQMTLSVSDRDFISDLNQIVGQQVLRKIRRHRVIKAYQLRPPQWINIGDKVIIEARSHGFYANMPGEALEGGGEGDAIRVRNLSSGKIITVYPIAKGRVGTLF